MKGKLIVILICVILCFTGCKKLAYVEDVRVVQIEAIKTPSNSDYYIITLDNGIRFLSSSSVRYSSGGDVHPKYATSGKYSFFRGPSGRFKLKPLSK